MVPFSGITSRALDNLKSTTLKPALSSFHGCQPASNLEGNQRGNQGRAERPYHFIINGQYVRIYTVYKGVGGPSLLLSAPSQIVSHVAFLNHHRETLGAGK
jgi:hypothetical protein